MKRKIRLFIEITHSTHSAKTPTWYCYRWRSFSSPPGTGKSPVEWEMGRRLQTLLTNVNLKKTTAASVSVLGLKGTVTPYQGLQREDLAISGQWVREVEDGGRRWGKAKEACTNQVKESTSVVVGGRIYIYIYIIKYLFLIKIKNLYPSLTKIFNILCSSDWTKLLILVNVFF